MKKYIVTTFFCLLLIENINAECNGKQIEKMINAGFSKNEIKKLCIQTNNDTAQVDRAIENLNTLIERHKTWHDVLQNAWESCYQKNISGWASDRERVRVDKICKPEARQIASSSVGMSIKTIHAKQEKIVKQLISIAHSNKKIESYIKTKLEPLSDYIAGGDNILYKFLGKYQ